MMMTIESYVRQGRMNLRKWAVNARVRLTVKLAAHFFSGLALSAASLGRSPQPIAMGLLCAQSGWRAAVTALGGGAGYLLFWKQAGYQGLLWLALALPAALLLKLPSREESPLLMTSIAGLVVAASGLAFQIFLGDTTGVPLYLLRVVLGAASTRFFEKQLDRTRPRRRGETGLAQVRLELMSGVLSQTRQLLMEIPPTPIDEEALLARTRERACGGCPCRKSCQERMNPLPALLLHRPMMDTSSITVPCKKPGRLVLELRRSQEQLRSIRADRERIAEYRAAVSQQYLFLENFLQQLADQLPRRHEHIHQQYEPDLGTASAALEAANGDRLLRFAGTGCKYYILLCDGMGTGLGAAHEGQTAAEMLRQMLSAGFPAEYALRSVNSLLALRGQAGAVTLDLAELELDSGRAAVYKWGAAPSYLLREGTAEKIGTAGPPPGLSVREGRETTHRLSLRRGEVLVLASDGVDGEDALRRCMIGSEQPPGELAAKILECGGGNQADDATVAVVRLIPNALST